MTTPVNNKKEITQEAAYPATLTVDYPEKLDKLTTFFRLFMIIPIAIILGLVVGSGQTVTRTILIDQSGDILRTTRDVTGGIVMGIPAAAALMILFRQRYPRWWFDFLHELTRFQNRLGAYASLLTDQYPSTEEQQSVHLNLRYPNAQTELNRWMPLVKWFLVIPHFIVLAFLATGAFFAIIFAWFAILFTGQYPRSLFDFVVGVMRWGLRVNAYVFLLVTDVYPPFSLN